MSNILSLSIIMPALNEEENVYAAIINTLNSFDDFGLNAEIIVVNDGSSDKTSEIVEDLCKKDQRVKLISHTTPEGIGASFWDGVDHSTKDTISMQPGDNENDPNETIRYLNLLNHDKNEFDNQVFVKVRSTGRLIKAKIDLKNDIANVNLLEDEYGISPGQACVFYSKNNQGYKVLGGGWINK